MKNPVLSKLFNQMADIMEILGEDRFRINSYRKVARIISDMPGDVEALLATGRLAADRILGLLFEACRDRSTNRIICRHQNKQQSS